MKAITKFWTDFNGIAGKLPADLVLLLSRVAVAGVFWRSAQTRINGWEMFGQSFQFFNISPSAVMLFQYEYALPLLSPAAAAYLGTAAEFLLSLMLVLGLGTRFAALGLLAVTAVIQFLVFPTAWPTHILWAALLLHLLREGGGRISLGWLAGRILGKRMESARRLSPSV